MQDETITTEASEQSSSVKTQHVYYEVSGDLLAKHKTLCDVIEFEGRPPTLIYCNTPSDTDLVTVMLKKRGIPAKKLIGHVPSHKVQQVVKECAGGEITAVVSTDIAARDMNVADFDYIVNYSVHNDPEVYLHRISGANHDEHQVRKVATLVGPVDFGSFHYLKKVLDINFEAAEPPSGAELAEANFNKLIKDAAAEPEEGEDKDKEFVETMTARIMESEHTASVVSYLLRNSLRVAEKSADSDSDSPRGHRGERGDKRGYDGYDRDDRQSRGRGRGRRYEDRERPDENLPPPPKDVRFYIGHGTEAGLSAEQFTKLVTTHTDLTTDQIKRLSLRDFYGFVDFPEEVADSASEALEGIELESGTSLLLKRAITIAEPRQRVSTESTEEGEVEEAAESKEETPESDTEERVEEASEASSA